MVVKFNNNSLCQKVIMHFFCIFISLLFCLLEVNANLNNPPEVSTPLGRVQGQWKTSYDGRQYAAFDGVPYAKPPIADLRFQEPQPIDPWLGIWNATQVYSCIQNSMDLETTTGVEDCLYVNVFVPTTTEQNLDVLIHIHGGGYMFGSGSSFVDAKYVMDRDLIFVTLNYRLGALGFLSTGDKVLPGNNGLKDQVLALKWVQQNIASFGGNPNSVTLTGFSAGGGSVHLHYLSPLSKGLFHRGMSMSGVATNYWVIRETTVEETRQFANVVGCSASDSEDLVQCLKTRPATLLVKNTKLLYPLAPAPICLFTPVVEKESKNPFLQKHPYKLIQEKNVLDLPWIASVTSHEGLVISLPFFDKLQEVDKKWNGVAADILDFREFRHRSDIPSKIKEFYLGKGESFNKDNIDKFTKMGSNLFFQIKPESIAKLHSRATKSPVYFFYFNYDKGKNSFTNFMLPEGYPGVSHGDDLIYFFGGLITTELSESDIKLKNACLDMLYSYAKYGIPSFKGVNWLPTGGEELTYLNITSADEITLQTTRDLTGTNEFWKEVGLLEDENLLIKNEL